MWAHRVCHKPSQQLQLSRIERAQLAVPPGPQLLHAQAAAIRAAPRGSARVFTAFAAGGGANVVLQVTTTARRHEADVRLLTQEDSAGLDRVTATALVDGLVVLDISVDDPGSSCSRASGTRSY